MLLDRLPALLSSHGSLRRLWPTETAADDWSGREVGTTTSTPGIVQSRCSATALNRAAMEQMMGVSEAANDEDAVATEASWQDRLLVTPKSSTGFGIV